VTLVLGLTGSIGMGKSATANLFREAGIAVHDADATVHDLYRGEAVAAIGAAFPGTTSAGEVDREALARAVLEDDAALARLESIVHPLVRAASEAFLQAAARRGERIVVLDIPLLFETGRERAVDVVVVVSAPEDVQKQRVMSRPGMTPERYEAILGKQTPDRDKRRRAHFVVDTSRDREAARAQVRGVLRAVAAMPGGAAVRRLGSGERNA